MPAPAPAQPQTEALAWVGAFQELQRQTADAHLAFLQVAEQSMRSLEAMSPALPPEALSRAATDGLELLRQGRDLVGYITRARVTMPKSTQEFVRRVNEYHEQVSGYYATSQAA